MRFRYDESGRTTLEGWEPDVPYPEIARNGLVHFLEADGWWAASEGLAALDEFRGGRVERWTCAGHTFVVVIDADRARVYFARDWDSDRGPFEPPFLELSHRELADALTAWQAFAPTPGP